MRRAAEERNVLAKNPIRRAEREKNATLVSTDPALSLFVLYEAAPVALVAGAALPFRAGSETNANERAIEPRCSDLRRDALY